MNNSLGIKRKLLLADDSVTIQKVVNLTFADENIEVVAVGDGDSAMKKFVEDPPDLVLVDVNMPGLDGYRICEMIKQDGDTRHIPVILLVGSFEPFNEEEARRVGADDFLTKPFQSIRQLVNKVTDLLEPQADEEEENFFLPVENAMQPVNGFETRTELLTSAEIAPVNVSSADLGDAGMDDEMIQTSQIAVAEPGSVVEYESEPISESESDYEMTAEKTFSTGADSESSEYVANSVDWELSEGAENSVNLEPSEVAEGSTDLEAPPTETEPISAPEPEEDRKKTQSLSEEDFAGITTEPGDSFGMKTAPLLNFDDVDLLEFPPPSRENAAARNGSAEFAEAAPYQNDGAADEVFSPTVEQPQTGAMTGHLSPETVEAIADKVVEKIASRFVERIVREVIAQMEEKT